MIKSWLTILLFCLCYISKAQSIIEKRVVYSSPGNSSQLTNMYGVSQLKGLPYENKYSSIVEAIDLGDKGYLLRYEYTIILLDTNFNKIKEHYIKESLIDGSEGKVNFYPSDKGVWISSDFKDPNNIRLGLLAYNGDLIIDRITLPERYKSVYSFFDNFRNAFVIQTSSLGSDSHPVIDYYFTESPSHYIKEESIIPEIKIEKESSLPDGFAELTFFDRIKNNNNNEYNARLKVKDLEGNCELEIGKIFRPNSIKKVIKLIIPEYKNITSRHVADNFIFQSDFKVFFDESTNDFFCFHSIAHMYNAKALIFISGNLYKDNFNIKSITIDELIKYDIRKKDLSQYSASNIMFRTDWTIYKENDYYLIDLHTRNGVSNSLIKENGHEPKSSGSSLLSEPNGTMLGSTITTFLELSVNKDLEIMKFSYLNHPVNCLKHRELKLTPKIVEDLYVDKNYKIQESDLIYKEIGKLKPKDNLYKFFQKNGFSYIVNFKSINSEIEVWKVKF